MESCRCHGLKCKTSVGKKNNNICTAILDNCRSPLCVKTVTLPTCFSLSFHCIHQVRSCDMFTPEPEVHTVDDFQVTLQEWSGAGVTNTAPAGTVWSPKTTCTACRPILKIAQLVELHVKLNFLQPCKVIINH